MKSHIVTKSGKHVAFLNEYLPSDALAGLCWSGTRRKWQDKCPSSWSTSDAERELLQRYPNAVPNVDFRIVIEKGAQRAVYGYIVSEQFLRTVATR